MGGPGAGSRVCCLQPALLLLRSQDVCRSEDEGKNKKNLARDLKKIKVIFLPPVKLCYLILMLLFVIDVNMRKIRDHNEAK